MVPPLSALLPVGLDIRPSFGKAAMSAGNPVTAGAATTGGAATAAGNPAEYIAAMADDEAGGLAAAGCSLNSARKSAAAAGVPCFNGRRPLGSFAAAAYS